MKISERVILAPMVDDQGAAAGLRHDARETNHGDPVPRARFP